MLQECENGHMTVGFEKQCSIYNSKIIGNYTRVVGFITSISDWNQTRRNEDFPNRKFYKMEYNK